VFRNLKTQLAIAASIAMAFLLTYAKGRRDQSESDHETEINEYVETRKRMDQVDIGNSDSAREWLRNRDKP
tara:strand:+ start:2687 stop:2899 length:213 start_codon:yes stop_codon:yes gene_type:complete